MTMEAIKLDPDAVMTALDAWHLDKRRTYASTPRSGMEAAITAYLSAIEPVEAAPAADGRRVAWLIERKGFAGDPRPHWYWEDTLGNHAWTPEAGAALPFKTKAEAEAFPAYRMISRDSDIAITEHMWMP